MIDNLDWSAISSIAAIFAAIFAGLTWKNSSKICKYTTTKEAPDLWLEKDVFAYNDYKIANVSDNCQIPDVPGNTVLLRRYPVFEQKTGRTLNRACIICNSSNKNSSQDKIDYYTDIFGELYFENRGEIAIKKIELAEFSFKMRENTGHNLESFSLISQGHLDVNIGRGSKFIVFICYLFDDNKHLLCDKQYIENGILKNEAIQKKRMYNDQLNCHLPVIIDLYEELSFSLIFTSKDEKKYKQQYCIKITLEENGGKYNSISNTPIIIK